MSSVFIYTLQATLVSLDFQNNVYTLKAKCIGSCEPEISWLRLAEGSNLNIPFFTSSSTLCDAAQSSRRARARKTIKLQSNDEV